MGIRTLLAALPFLAVSACGGLGAGERDDPFAAPPRAAGVGDRAPDTELAASGHVLTLPAREALGGARILLLDRGGQERARAVSDAEGRFQLGPVEQGSYTLEVEAEGHRGIRDRIDFRGQAPARLTIELPALDDDGAPEPTAVLVTSRSYLEEMGFYQRQQTRSGLFLVREQIRDRNPGRTSDLIGGRHGFRLVGGIVMGRRRCPAGLFLDGLGVGDTRSLDRMVPPAAIEGLEAYAGDYTPPGMVPRGCGSVVIWTRRG
jgi:hypothetical protein